MKAAKKNVLAEKVSKEFGRPLRVYVGYGWQKFDEDEIAAAPKGRVVLADIFWQSLKKELVGKCEGVTKRTGVKVELSRLRASHGQLMWPSVVKRIEKADALVFDMAQPPEKEVDLSSARNLEHIITDLNKNVLIEIGVALAYKRPVILMCPEHLMKKVPSDLSGYLLTTYKGTIKNKVLERVITDQPGFQSGFMGMLKDIVREATGIDF